MYTLFMPGVKTMRAKVTSCFLPLLAVKFWAVSTILYTVILEIFTVVNNSRLQETANIKNSGKFNLNKLCHSEYLRPLAIETANNRLQQKLNTQK